VKNNDQTDIGGDGQTFLTTHWSLIESIRTDLDTRDTKTIWKLPILPVYYDAAWRRPMPTDYEPIPIE